MANRTVFLAVAKDFQYALDGVNFVIHKAGSVAEIAAQHVEGLAAAGILKVEGRPSQKPAPETKVITGAPEKSAPIDQSGASDLNVEPPVDPNPFASVVIPADWEAMDWPQLRSLATSVSATAVNNKADATTAIDAELTRRIEFNAANLPAKE